MSRSDGKDPDKSELTPENGTRIDLGEDLLERTAVLRSPDSVPAAESAPAFVQPEIPSSAVSLAGDQIADHLQSARILMGEGILEDAKRVLRRVLLSDPGIVEARQMLEEIHEVELKQIFGESENPRRAMGRRSKATPIEESADEVMRGLDRDLKLGIYDSRLSLFRDKDAMDEFGARMDRDFAASPASERVDLGIAFLEMGLHDLAARHFVAASAALARDGEAASDELLSATGLLAYALILGERAFEATIALQPLLNDVEIDKARKLDLIYLMGRALEAMGKAADARQWYAQAADIEPGYRDTPEKLGKARLR